VSALLSGHAQADVNAGQTQLARDYQKARAQTLAGALSGNDPNAAFTLAASPFPDLQQMGTSLAGRRLSLSQALQGIPGAEGGDTPASAPPQNPEAMGSTTPVGPTVGVASVSGPSTPVAGAAQPGAAPAGSQGPFPTWMNAQSATRMVLSGDPGAAALGKAWLEQNGPTPEQKNLAAAGFSGPGAQAAMTAHLFPPIAGRADAPMVNPLTGEMTFAPSATTGGRLMADPSSPNGYRWVETPGAIAGQAAREAAITGGRVANTPQLLPNSSGAQTWQYPPTPPALRGPLPTPGLQNVGPMGPAPQGAAAQSTPLAGITPAATAPAQPRVWQSDGGSAGQTTAMKAGQEEMGKAGVAYYQKVMQDATNAYHSRVTLNEMNDLLQNFDPSKVAPMQRFIIQWRNALPRGVPGAPSDDEIQKAGSIEDFGKLTAQLATAAMKEFTNRGTQLEFKTFLANNPNAEMTPWGIQRMLSYMDRVSQTSIDKLASFERFRGRNPQDPSAWLPFENTWTQQLVGAMPAIPGQRPQQPGQSTAAAPAPLPTQRGSNAQVVRTGTAADGRRVIQYSDGRVEYVR